MDVFASVYQYLQPFDYFLPVRHSTSPPFLHSLSTSTQRNSSVLSKPTAM
jgi:hypothetical protein